VSGRALEEAETPREREKKRGKTFDGKSEKPSIIRPPR
jgi:hypothetical protein